MEINFCKYQGTGNDFIMVDNRDLKWSPASEKLISHLCDRRFGIGADGFILLEELPGYDFKMVYYNSDGRESSMCGNGGRCIVKFAFDLGIEKDVYHFRAVDGDHLAKIDDRGVVSLQMIDVKEVVQKGDDFFADTGSPHHLVFRKNIDGMELITEAHKIRYSEEYREKGVNVNFIEPENDKSLKMRTYERGVEDETYSCGTGVTAAALAFHSSGRTNRDEVEIHTRGGMLKVGFKPGETGYGNIWLSGAATFVFKGTVEI